MHHSLLKPRPYTGRDPQLPQIVVSMSEIQPEKTMEGSDTIHWYSG